MISSPNAEDPYKAEEAEIGALRDKTPIIDRDRQDFAAQVAAIRLKHHEARTKQQS